MAAEDAPAAEDDEGQGDERQEQARSMPGVRAWVQGVRRRRMGDDPPGGRKPPTCR